MYEVILSNEAAEFFDSAVRPLSSKLARCFAQLEAEPRRNNNVKALTGEFKGYFRYRVGDYRVVYRIDEAKQQVLVAMIAHRSEVYE